MLIKITNSNGAKKSNRICLWQQMTYKIINLASGGLPKCSEPIRLQHSYHVTFSEIPSEIPSEMHLKCIQSFPKLSQLYPKCIPNNSCIPVECILPALYHTLGRGGWGREGALSKGSLSYNNAFQYDAYLTYSNTVKIPNLSQMYQKSIPNSNKNTIFLQNKPTIRPETNQISSIHCKK